MNSAHVFFKEGKLYLIPELPTEQHNLHLPVEIEKVKANALPVVNPDAIDELYLQSILEGKFYKWPGTWEKVRSSQSYERGTSVVDVAKLIAPQQTQSDAPNEKKINFDKFKNRSLFDKKAPNEGREEKIATQIARKIAAIPENKPEHAADHKLRAIEEIIDNTIKMVERHTGKDLRDQLSKERENSGALAMMAAEKQATINGLKEQLEKEREMRKELVKWMEGFKKLEPIITYPDNVPPEHEGEMIALSNALYKMKHLIAKASNL